MYAVERHLGIHCGILTGFLRDSCGILENALQSEMLGILGTSEHVQRPWGLHFRLFPVTGGFRIPGIPAIIQRS